MTYMCNGMMLNKLYEKHIVKVYLESKPISYPKLLFIKHFTNSIPEMVCKIGGKRTHITD
ncbi:hypothetical protein PROVRETT_05367 [Providencia rettgeri DSM 1131]|nr:hypothetical protein PROVRETT_05367 [Providencia rettgeri DSM 1131]BBU96164.1 hypothetical protein BML2496_20470 [Providencia rettgeri]BBV01289.1 hypothetical protein BML2526_29410 [Providencia rettgeri]BBV04291.1 hypothetical protein BML2531_20670 [Providencia rettgeri]BBV12367.1 hypothetical protein BML2576_18260 [Providencia rettgeri]